MSRVPIAPSVYAARRGKLRARLSGPALLIGHKNRVRNIPILHLPFRQDSTFLFFTGVIEPNAAWLSADGRDVLFLEPPASDDALWHGRSRSIEERATAFGFAEVRSMTDLEVTVRALGGRPMGLAVADASANAELAQLIGVPLHFGRDHGSDELVLAVADLRLRRDAADLAVLRDLHAVTVAAHRAAMSVTRPGLHERQIAAVFHATLEARGCVPAYPSIVTVRGEVLHEFGQHNTLEHGQLLLVDGGAESPTGLGTDVTRTWPVDGRYSARQRAAYDAVHAAQAAGIARATVGTRYRDVHDAAALTLARWLRDEGLLLCDPSSAVEAGAHAVFFPHGVGHLLGMDVHDLENFGDRVAYAKGRGRSPQFGTAYLRLDRDLEAGMVVTVEPGFYLAPSILNDRDLRERFRGLVDFERAVAWTGFGGIRIEDDVLVRPEGPEVLSADVPSEPAAIESLVGTADLPGWLGA